MSFRSSIREVLEDLDLYSPPGAWAIGAVRRTAQVLGFWMLLSVFVCLGASGWAGVEPTRECLLRSAAAASPAVTMFALALAQRSRRSRARRR